MRGPMQKPRKADLYAEIERLRGPSLKTQTRSLGGLLGIVAVGFVSFMCGLIVAGL